MCSTPFRHNKWHRHSSFSHTSNIRGLPPGSGTPLSFLLMSPAADCGGKPVESYHKRVHIPRHGGGKVAVLSHSGLHLRHSWDTFSSGGCCVDRVMCIWAARGLKSETYLDKLLIKCKFLYDPGIDNIDNFYNKKKSNVIEMKILRRYNLAKCDCVVI